MELMTQADYARHRGVSRQAVNKAIGAGKIPVHPMDGGKKGIDPAEADRALGLNVSRVLADDSEGPSPRGSDPAALPSSGLTRAKTATEVYRARLAELEYNERLGKLRPVEDVTIAAQRCAEVVLRAIHRITGRADEIAAQCAKDGVMGARTGLRSIDRDLCRVVAAAFAKLAAGELDGPDDAAEVEQS
jgi:hypothetical protein